MAVVMNRGIKRARERGRWTRNAWGKDAIKTIDAIRSWLPPSVMKLKSNLTIILLQLLLATAIFAEKSSDDYIADLKSEDMNIQIAAARKLGASKVEKALPDLTALLKSPATDVQVAAATAIGAIGKKGAASDELLALAAGSKSGLVKYAAYVALANTVDKDKTVAYQEALNKELASSDPLLKDLASKLKKEDKKAKESDQG